jgi:hypothetical protein
MVSENDQQSIIIQLVDNIPQHPVHLKQLCPHDIPVWPDSMADMVDAQKVSNQDIPFFRVCGIEVWEEMLNHAIVDRM